MRISARNIIKGKIVDVVKGQTTAHVTYRRRWRHRHRVDHQRVRRRSRVEKGNGGVGRHQVIRCHGCGRLNARRARCLGIAAERGGGARAGRARQRHAGEGHVGRLRNLSSGRSTRNAPPSTTPAWRRSARAPRASVERAGVALALVRVADVAYALPPAEKKKEGSGAQSPACWPRRTRQARRLPGDAVSRRLDRPRAGRRGPRVGRSLGRQDLSGAAQKRALEVGAAPVVLQISGAPAEPSKSPSTGSRRSYSSPSSRGLASATVSFVRRRTGASFRLLLALPRLARSSASSRAARPLLLPFALALAHGAFCRGTRHRRRPGPRAGRCAGASRAPAACRRSSACAACRPAWSGRARSSPLKPTTSQTSSRQLDDRQVLAGADVDVLGRRIVPSSGSTSASAQSSTCRNSRRGVPVPQIDELGVAAQLRLVRLADQRRQDVARLQVEVVAGAVEIGRHRRDEVAAVLPAIGLAQLDAGDLGDRVPLVGRLERAGQQRVLGDRLRRELRIDAGRAEEQQLLDAGRVARRG